MHVNSHVYFLTIHLQELYLEAHPLAPLLPPFPEKKKHCQEEVMQAERCGEPSAVPQGFSMQLGSMHLVIYLVVVGKERQYS